VDEVFPAVGASQLGNGVPQTDEHLLAAAAYLLQRGNIREASLVSARAVSAGGRVEPSLRRRLNLAIESRWKPFIADAARELLSLANEPESFAAVARGLTQIGDTSAADAAIDRGLSANPHDAGLVLAGARQRMARDDLPGALAFLNRRDENRLTLADRIQFDELGASLADRRGDPVTAAALRANARDLARLANRAGSQ
jgi:hypothetical protein